jgi:hypothetical protein
VKSANVCYVQPATGTGTNYPLTTLIDAYMTRLTIVEAPGQEFAVRGQNTVTEVNEDGIIFYDDVTKVHVLPDRHSFTIQVITPDLDVEMDFPDADSVRDALAQFEAKRVSEVDAEAQGSVRIVPTEPEAVEAST